MGNRALVVAQQCRFLRLKSQKLRLRLRSLCALTTVTQTQLVGMCGVISSEYDLSLQCLRQQEPWRHNGQHLPSAATAFLASDSRRTRVVCVVRVLGGMRLRTLHLHQSPIQHHPRGTNAVTRICGCRRVQWRNRDDIEVVVGRHARHSRRLGYRTNHWPLAWNHHTASTFSRSIRRVYLGATDTGCPVSNCRTLSVRILRVGETLAVSVRHQSSSGTTSRRLGVWPDQE